jgi:hypothetical protein
MYTLTGCYCDVGIKMFVYKVALVADLLSVGVEAKCFLQDRVKHEVAILLRRPICQAQQG